MDPAALAAGPATFQLDLTPSAGSSGLAGALAGARAALARRLLRWNPDLGGVLLGIRDERLVGGVAPIGEVFPLVRVQVAAHVTVFRPRPGMALSGVINKVGADHIGILTLGAINAAVGADRVRAAFVRPPGRSASSTPAASPGAGGTGAGAGGAAWNHATEPGHALAVGTPVVYDCVRVRADGGGFASVVGSLEAPHTGAAGQVPPAPRWSPPPRPPRPAAAAGVQEATTPPPPSSVKSGKKDKKKGGGKAKAAANGRGGGPEKKRKKEGGGGSESGKKGRRGE